MELFRNFVFHASELVRLLCFIFQKHVYIPPDNA